MRGGIFRVELNGPTNQFESDVFPANLVSDHAKVMQGLSMRRLHREDLAVEPLGISQAPGPMMLEGQRKCLLSAHRRQEGCPAHQCCHIVR